MSTFDWYASTPDRDVSGSSNVTRSEYHSRSIGSKNPAYSRRKARFSSSTEARIAGTDSWLEAGVVDVVDDEVVAWSAVGENNDDEDDDEEDELDRCCWASFVLDAGK
jgi:hypothetical protein